MQICLTFLTGLAKIVISVSDVCLDQAISQLTMATRNMGGHCHLIVRRLIGVGMSHPTTLLNAAKVRELREALRRLREARAAENGAETMIAERKLNMLIDQIPRVPCPPTTKKS